MSATASAKSRLHSSVRTGTFVRFPLAARWRASLAGLGLVGVFMAVFLGYRTRNEWFEVDEWEFLTTRVGPHPPRGLLTPHNEHPSMIPILIWRALFTEFGIIRYWPYMAVLIVFHLGVTVAVWLVARRCGAGPGACLVVAAVMASLGYGGDNMVWAFQIGMVGSLLASWLGTLLVDDRTRPDQTRTGQPWRRLIATWAVLVAGLCCSAVSVPLLLMPLLVGATRRGWRAGVTAISVPLALFLVWYPIWGRTGATASKGFQPFQLAVYTIAGLSSAIDGVTGVTGAAAAAGLLVLVAVRRGWLGTPSTVMETAGVLGAVGLFAFISIGRSSLGTIEAESSRYAYLVTALILPAAAVGLQRLLDTNPGPAWGDQRRITATWLVIVIATVGLVDRGLGLLETRIAPRVILGAQIRTEAAAADALVATGAPLLDGVSLNHYSAYLNGAGIIRLHRLHAFTGLAHPDAGIISQVRLLFQTTLLSTHEPRSMFLTDTKPPRAAPIREFFPAQPSPAALNAIPGPFAGAPTLLHGLLTPSPPNLSRGLRCVTAQPDTTGHLLVSLALTNRPLVAEYLLAPRSTIIAYGWAGSNHVLASQPAQILATTVYQLTSLTRTGTLDISSPEPLTLCPVAPSRP